MFPKFLQNHFLESPQSEKEMFKQVSDILFSDDFDSTPGDLDQSNEIEFEFALELLGKNNPDLFKQVSDILFSDDFDSTPGDLDQLNEIEFDFALELLDKNNPDENVAKLSPGMTQQQMQEKLACRHSVHMPKKKDKTSKRNGYWSEEEIRLFWSGLDKYGWGQWKNISSHIGTRSPEQVRSYARRMQLKWSSKQDIQSLPPETNRPIANPGHLPFTRTVMEPMVWAPNVPPPIWRDLPSLRPEHGLDDIDGTFGGSVCYLRTETGANPSSRISDQVWNSTNTLWSDSYGCLPGPSAYGNNMNPGQ